MVERIRLDEYAARLDARKTELGLVIVPEQLRNSGKRRTDSKRALLQAVAEEAKRQGRKPPFAANY